MMDLSVKLKRMIVFCLTALCISACLYSPAVTAYAEETSIAIKGNIYEFSRDAHYEFSSADKISDSNPFGALTISGSLKNSGEKNGFPAYSVSSENARFYYSYPPSLNANETEWRLTDDKTKRVDAISLEKNILNGATIIQSSRDGESWITDTTMTNVFASESTSSEALYTTKDIQLFNGCYYRIIIAYKLQRKTGENQVLFVTKNTIEEKKICEVYEFYAISSEIVENTVDNAEVNKKLLGQRVKTDKGYFGEYDIDKNDPHFGWDLGTFTIDGFTRETVDETTHNPVFLKNIGDKVTLWFTLTQDINKLNGNSAFTISEDIDGYDQAFEIEQQNFKHGALIIQYTDFTGVKHKPIYTDFLAANATTAADTRVQLFEEGDYTVSLDYEIKNSPRQIGTVSILPTYTNYKISFSFSVRNGNCMVYPFDAATGNELSDQAVAPKGFKLDTAKSRYLNIDITRNVLNVGTNGQLTLTEDQRFNRPAKDADIFDDEGIYTFKVTNPYTEETTTKTIYVGTNKYLLALSKNSLTVKELNEKIAQGAMIHDDGTISDHASESEPKLPAQEDSKVQPVMAVNAPANPTVEPPATDAPPVAAENPPNHATSSKSYMPPVSAAVIAGIFVVWFILKKHKSKGD